MERPVILLEDLIAVFERELGHVLEEVDPKGPGRPPIYPAKGLFLSWLVLYLGIADSQRRLVQLLTQHPEWRTRLGFDDRVPDQSTFSWFKNHRARHAFQRVFDEAVLASYTGEGEENSHRSYAPRYQSYLFLYTSI